VHYVIYDTDNVSLIHRSIPGRGCESGAVLGNRLKGGGKMNILNEKIKLL
jgi:hypothetical protein